jgi:hypothetical protein
MEFNWRFERFRSRLCHPVTQSKTKKMNGMPTSPAPLAAPKSSALAITSLVLGILSLVFACFLGPILFAIPAIICGHVAHSRIKNSGGQLTGAGTAIGGFVTGYISLAILPLLMAIAIPNFVRARQTAFRNQCVSNLRIIDSAKQQWVQEHPDKKNTIPTAADLQPYLGNLGVRSLKCPAGGIYDFKSPTAEPTCSIPDHHL